jgi:hypothetical protein
MRDALAIGTAAGGKSAEHILETADLDLQIHRG